MPATLRICCLLAVLHLTFVARSLQAKCYGSLSKQEFPHCLKMSDNYVLHWSVRNDSVQFGIEVDQTGGWFALGLSEGGGMRGADIWVFTKDASGNWIAKDSFADDYVSPEEDNQQDISVISVTQNTQSTALVFTRKLETCDYEWDQVIYPKYRQSYIFAYGSEWGYHGPIHRGTMFLVLDSPDSEPATVKVVASDEQQQLLPLLMPNITVPTDETSYLCTNFKAPSSARYQIISTNYSITPSKLVHHMLLYSCYRKPDVPVGEIYPCFSTPAECSNLYLLWVPGQESEEMPANTGFPFGADSYQYFMLQVHYTNPEGKEGVKDNSGFIPTYTSQLRKHDLGVMWVGAEQFEIPAAQESFTLPPNICPSECTSKFKFDLNLDMSEFHMHQIGSRQTAQHLRQQPTGGFEEIVPLNYRNYYDFNWQGGTFILPGGDTLVRGDALITTCTYNSKSRSNVTRFGLGSFDEMCYNFIRYWPAQKIDRCITVQGTEVNGTAFVECTNQRDYFEYFSTKNITDFNESVITDLMDKGFWMRYNTSQYRNFKPYNRTSALCAASTPALSSSPVWKGNNSSTGANETKPADSSTAGIAPRLAQVILLVAAVVMLLLDNKC